MLHPILALNNVVDEYRDYIRTEFRAKDPELMAALERELDQPQFLAQEPFFQAHRPFRHGRAWAELPIDARLARVMEERSRGQNAYLHQSQAIEELLSPNPLPVVVTTGTGSGKTEAFLLPVIQNAIADAAQFRKRGLTAILVYPMNALANDQKLRIDEYLTSAGFEGVVSVEQYDRGTTQSKREELRRNPPHILLTNYMMLEYLLVRPADRENIFANHRCRFLVLDEVHTYRGTLGSNIALLVRRLREHLANARHDWMPDVADNQRAARYPAFVPIGTSATIKSVAEENRTREEINHLRDEAVQQFFASLTGVQADSIRVFGEELEDIHVPNDAVYPPEPVNVGEFNATDAEQVRRAICRLAGLEPTASAERAAARCRLLWDLNASLVRSPLSLSQIVDRVQREIPERRDADRDAVRREVEAALIAGAALPENVAGGLRLRVHRFIRGGWQFHRCVNPGCGRLYPMGEQRCECGHPTAPLFLCRNCGADYLRFVGDPEEGTLRPSAVLKDGPEHMLFEHGRFDALLADDEDDDDADQDEPRPRSGRRRAPRQMRQRPVLQGSFDPNSLQFSLNEDDYRVRAMLAPARTKCLCCGGSAGSRSVVTPVALGTSAAAKVMSESLVEALSVANRGREGHDGKERLLIFSDSRQDAAHQARFIIFASRYDRMRRRLVQILQDNGPLPVQRAIEFLADAGVQQRDNPYIPQDYEGWLNEDERERIQAYEEAPLLDDISVNAGYRGTLVNLGVMAVGYDRLDEYVRVRGADIAGELGVTIEQLEHICRCLLDEMRGRGCLSRKMLQYHPLHPACPHYMRAAEWERRVKQPRGVACSDAGHPVPQLDAAMVPQGITHTNVWRRQGGGGKGPGLERMLKHFCERFGAPVPLVEAMMNLLDFLRRGRFILAEELFGARDRRRLYQVNAGNVRLILTDAASRFRCQVCGKPCSATRAGLPCPQCHGVLVQWRDNEVEENRTVRRIRSQRIVPLIAREHTAQVTNDERIRSEDAFKAPPAESKVNVLACSPTLEMGIDVGGLDAVVMRNVPPRPDNYAQRGGRAGRRSRVGLVLGYARSTPHDQYFYDKPAEMISGEVPAPAFNVGNRDVLLRHLAAIAFSMAEPGLAGKMVEYVSPSGEVKHEPVDQLIQAVVAQAERAIAMARSAWGPAVLQNANLSEDDLRAHMSSLSARIQDVMNRTARQVIELRQPLDYFSAELQRARAGTRSAELIARLLGIQTERQQGQTEADDRSAGYPLRRFAEFGILPGYEFPTEPASLRLLGDEHEEDPVTVGRRFGINQFQPDAQVYARARRWKVIGLDMSSPWNPRAEGPGWHYRKCPICELRHRADFPSCPRCGHAAPGRGLPAYEFAGFLSRRDESPILDEEDRFATRNLVKAYPQRDGTITGRWMIGPGWGLSLSCREHVHWVNEGLPPSTQELAEGTPLLHNEAKGWMLCPACGVVLRATPPERNANRGRRRANGPNNDDPNGHREGCHRRGQEPTPLAIATEGQAEILRLVVPVPDGLNRDGILSWGLSLGYALHLGMRRLYMLDGREIEFELEGPWRPQDDGHAYSKACLTFIDGSLGGTGYLRRIAENFHRVADRAVEHLNHPGCETACYRCLKAYDNQRYHEQLSWPRVIADLEELAAITPAVRPPETGDIDDPRPWLEAYAAGVGSPLELRFWRLFEQHGFRPEKQVPVAPSDGEPAISVADFAVQADRLAIYIDGAAFHVGNNLRRDRYIRRRLREGNPPWRVEELRAADLGQGVRLVERLRGS